jgi:hypothetical protein
MVVAERWGVRDGDPSDDGVVLATRGEKLLRPGPAGCGSAGYRASEMRLYARRHATMGRVLTVLAGVGDVV